MTTRAPAHLSGDRRLDVPYPTETRRGHRRLAAHEQVEAVRARRSISWLQAGRGASVRVRAAWALAVTLGVLLSSSAVGFHSGTGSVGAATTAVDPLAAAEASLSEGGGPAAGSPASCGATLALGATCAGDGAATSGGPTANSPPPVSTPAGEWEPVNYSRAYIALAYDARDGYVLAFGGQGPGGALGDTWKYQRGNWTVLLTATEPSPRWGASMTYDDGMASIVLFGGENATTYFNDTWEFAGGIWTPVVTSTAPSPRAFAGLTYDANTTDNYTVLFGGSNATATFGDTWTFHNQAWTLVPSAVSPPALSGSSFVFDRHIGYGVLFGGILSSGAFSSATWEFKNKVWTLEPETTSPPARAYAGMAYDRAYSVTALVLFGGLTASGVVGDTWELIGQTWTQISASTPGLSSRAGVALAFDGLHPSDFYVVQWGGVAGSTYTTDTWNFTGTAWTEVTPGGHPEPLTGAAFVNLPNDRYSVLFGGLGPLGPTNATWLYEGGSWKLLCAACGPSPRYDAAATYSRTLGGMILFGGVGVGGQYLNDTWELTNGVWQNVTGGTAPTPRSGAGFDFFPSPLNESVLFGGFNGSAYLNDTWEFSALSQAWHEVTPNVAPPARADSAFTDDPIDGYMLLFGGLNSTGLLSDTWKFLGGPLQTWEAIPTSLSPPARAAAQAQYDPYNGYVVLTGGYNGTVFYNDTWEYIGGNWTNFAPPATPPPRADAALTFDRYSKYIVQFGGFTSGGALLSDTWLWVAFSAQATASPDPVDAGVAVAFGVSATAGVQPYHYTWQFGDGTSTMVAAPYHVYTTAGSYNASVTVTDSHLPTVDTTLANVTVVVNPTLTIESATATPSTATPNERVVFTSEVVGGTRPLTYTWTFGDGGSAATQNTSHAYATAGDYSATLLVNDSIGITATVTVPVTIAGGLSAMVSALPAQTDVGVAVAYASTPSGGTAPYTFSWLFGDGASSAAQSPSHAFAAAGTYVAQYWLNDSLGQSFHTTTSVTVVPLPTVSISVVPAALDVGVSATFSATVSNGTGPYSYLWTFGDGGTASTASATHAYGSTGTFAVHLALNDSVGAPTGASTPVRVAPDPTISAFTASPSPVVSGSTVAFSASASGGTGALTYSYSGLPPGCSGGNVSSFECVPSATGTYTVHLTVTDQFGKGANATASLQVNAPAPSHGSTFLGLPGDEGYWLLIGVVAALAVILVGVAYGMSRRKPPRAPTTSPNPPTPPSEAAESPPP